MTERGVGPDPSAFDAVILAGGRASRLGGVDKPALQVRGRSLLAAAIDAVRQSGAIVVVGPDRDRAALDGSRVRFAREDPPFSGPAAALATGLDALGDLAAPSVLVLASDLPNAAAAVERLVGAPDGADGVVAVDSSGRRQHLLGRYRTAALLDRFSQLRTGGPIEGSSLRRVLDTLELDEVVLGDELCSDVDTAEDARRFGIRLPSSTPEGTE